MRYLDSYINNSLYKRLDDYKTFSFVDHMTEADLEYFYKWYHLIMLEAQAEASSSSQNKIWTKTSSELYSAGKCLNEMLLKFEVAQGGLFSLR